MGHNGSLTKWVVGTVCTGLLGLLSFLALQDRSRIEGTADKAMVLSTSNDRTLAVVQSELSAIRSQLSAIEATQREILKALHERPR